MHRSHTQINTSLQIPLCLIQERPLELDRMFKYVARDPESRKERKGRDKRLMSVLLLSVALVSGVCVNLCCLSISSSCLSLLLYQSFFFFVYTISSTWSHCSAALQFVLSWARATLADQQCAPYVQRPSPLL